MPFRDDRRLGGPRNNELTLNGISEGPDYPAAGTILNVFTNVNRTEVYGGQLLSYQYGETTYTDYQEVYDVNLVADGNGNEYMDYSGGFNVHYKPAGTVVATSLSNDPHYLYFDVDEQNYENGYVTGEIRHDGSGQLYFTTFTTYNTTNVFFYTNVDVYSNLGGTDYVVGTATREYRHDGSGGYTTEEKDQNYYHEGYVVGSGSYQNYTSIGGVDYPIGDTSYEVLSNGLGTAVYGSMNTVWYTYGTLITTYEGYDYFSDEAGGTYSQESASYPSDGTPTGNYESGDNYVNINGTDYYNGTYSGTEYHDGSGGTYWSYEYSYQPYGYEFFSETYYDEGSMMDVTTYYKSDEAGGYYTDNG